MSDQERREFLQDGHTAVLTTLRQDGRPSAVPLWYVMVSGSMYIGTPRNAAKLGHLRRDPRCCVLVESGRAWRELRAMQIQANAVVLSPGEEAEAVQAEFDRKYADFRTPFRDMPDAAQAKYADTVWIRLEPTGDPLTWDNSKIRLKR
jgi:PPOX class probable F420-dependent enzyme